MSSISRNKRRKLIYAIYCICNSISKSCQIRQDPLRYRYPDTNYGLRIEDSVENLLKMKNSIKEFFNKTQYEISSLEIRKEIKSLHKEIEVLEIFGLYSKRC